MPTTSHGIGRWNTPTRRSRNSILEALALFEALELPRGFHCLSVFLYVCENEGLTITELAWLTGSTVSVVARTVRIMAGEVVERGPATSHILLTLDPASDRRLKLVRLTREGRDLRDRLEALIAAARPILPRRARSGAQSSGERAP